MCWLKEFRVFSFRFCFVLLLLFVVSFCVVFRFSFFVIEPAERYTASPRFGVYAKAIKSEAEATKSAAGGAKSIGGNKQNTGRNKQNIGRKK